jgi:hypothetical protein
VPINTSPYIQTLHQLTLTSGTSLSSNQHLMFSWLLFFLLHLISQDTTLENYLELGSWDPSIQWMQEDVG